MLPNGFIPSALRPNLMFLASFSKYGNSLSMFLHWDPSAGCLRNTSCLRSSLCHRINLAFSLLLNKRFRRGIIGKYHITLDGILFGVGSPSTSPGSSRLILYRNVPQTGQESRFSYSSPWYKIQSLGHLCIFCTSNPRGQTIFLASYVDGGSSLSAGRSFTIVNSSSNPLSETPFVAFHYSISSVVRNFLCSSLQPGYNNFL